MSNGRIVETHVETLRLQWFHGDCGGELVSDPSVVQLLQIGSNGSFRMQYIHECTRCKVRIPSRHSYPRLVAKGSPVDI